MYISTIMGMVVKILICLIKLKIVQFIMGCLIHVLNRLENWWNLHFLSIQHLKAATILQVVFHRKPYPRLLLTLATCAQVLPLHTDCVKVYANLSPSLSDRVGEWEESNIGLWAVFNSMLFSFRFSRWRHWAIRPNSLYLRNKKVLFFCTNFLESITSLIYVIIHIYLCVCVLQFHDEWFYFPSMYFSKILILTTLIMDTLKMCCFELVLMLDSWFMS